MVEAFALALLLAAAGASNDDDVVAALECRANPDDAATIVALATNDPNYGAARGWTLEPDSPLYRPTYKLAKPITVFGLTTEKITIMSGNTMFAIMPGVSPASLAATLQIKPDLADDETFLGARVVKLVDFLDPSDGTHTHYKVALQLSNFGLGGADTRIGCSYSVTEPPAPAK